MTTAAIDFRIDYQGRVYRVLYVAGSIGFHGTQPRTVLLELIPGSRGHEWKTVKEQFIEVSTKDDAETFLRVYLNTLK